MELMACLRQQRVHLLALVIAVAAVFGASLTNGFVWDDNIFVVGREVYRKFQIGGMFLSPGNGVEYLPLRDLTYGIDYLVWGEHPAGFHFTNLLLHAGATVAAYGMAVRLLLLVVPEKGGEHARAAAFFTALAFAVHPVQSQAVNFIICRNVVLSGLFFFLTCRFFLSFLTAGARRLRYYAAALLCCLAALLSKATVIILPVVLLLFTIAASARGLRRSYLSLIPFFLVSAGFFFLFKKVAVHANVIGARAAGGVAEKAAIAFQIPLFYLKKMIIPTGFPAEYQIAFSRQIADPATLLAVAVLLVLVMVAFILRRRRPELLFSLAWFIVTLLPVLNFFNTVPLVADRYVYLPAWAFSFALATSLCAAGNARVRAALLGGGVLLLGVWSVISFARNGVWKSDRTLWEDVLKSYPVESKASVKLSPLQVKALLNLGESYFRDRDDARAFTLFELVAQDPQAKDYLSLHQGIRASEKGELTVAVNSFKKALERNDEFINALYPLGRAYERLGDVESAIQYYNQTIASSDIDTSNFRGQARAGLQRIAAAAAPRLEPLRQAVAANPRDLRARGELALRLDALGMYDEALQHYRALEQLGIREWQLSYNIANVLKRQKKYGEAREAYERSAVLNPTADSLNNIGWLFLEQGDHDRAIAVLRKAIELDPGYPLAWFNLGRAYHRKNDRDNSIRTFTAVRERFPELAPKAAMYLNDLQNN